MIPAPVLVQIVPCADHLIARVVLIVLAIDAVGFLTGWWARGRRRDA